MSAYLLQSVNRTHLSPQPDDSTASPSQLRARVMHAEAAAAAEEGLARPVSGGGAEEQQQDEDVDDGRTDSTAVTTSSRQPHAARSLSFAESPPTPPTALVHAVGGSSGGQGPHTTTVARGSQRRAGTGPSTAAKPHPRSSGVTVETTPATAMVMRQLYPTELHTADSFQGFAGSFRTTAPGSGGGSGVPRQLVARASHHKVRARLSVGRTGAHEHRCRDVADRSDASCGGLGR